MRYSLSLSSVAGNILDEISNKSFDGNSSAVVEYILRRISPQQFYKYMAKHHCSEMNKFRELCIEIEKKPEIQERIKEMI